MPNPDISSQSGSALRVLLLIVVLGAIVFGAAYMGTRESQSQEQLLKLAIGTMAGFEIYERPVPIPATAFQDRSGQPVSFADFSGQVVLANFWATWCAPCLTEMPALDRLSARLEGTDIRVITISLDRKGYEAIDPFFEEVSLHNLPAYLDRSNKLSLQLRASALPTTVLIGSDGQVLGRIVGPAEWDSDEAVALLQAAAVQ